MSAAAVVATAFVAGCGSESGSPSGVAYSDWQSQACTLLKDYSADLAVEKPSAPGFTGTGVPRDRVKDLQVLASELDALPLPSERRGDAEQVVTAFKLQSQRWTEAPPRIEEKTKRLDEAMNSVDPNTLPEPPEGETAVGGIMTQLLAVPAVRTAWDDLMQEYASLAKASDEREAKALLVQAGLEDCRPPPR